MVSSSFCLKRVDMVAHILVAGFLLVSFTEVGLKCRQGVNHPLSFAKL